MSEQTDTQSVGLCCCGCGLPAPIATRTNRRLGIVRGQSLRFLLGHNGRQDLGERFWSKVNKNGPIIRPELGPCWLWTGYLDQDGYGDIEVNGRHRRAHHVALEFAGWIIPCEWLEALHLCDNTSCVRPDHLKIGTKHDNVADRVAKGRQARGEDQHLAKMNPTKVREIRALYQRGVRSLGFGALAKRFGVSPQTINDIVSGRTWKHIAPLEMANELCGPDCPRYGQDPQAGHFWPGEDE